MEAFALLLHQVSEEYPKINTTTHIFFRMSEYLSIMNNFKK